MWSELLKTHEKAGLRSGCCTLPSYRRARVVVNARKVRLIGGAARKMIGWMRRPWRLARIYPELLYPVLKRERPTCTERSTKRKVIDLHGNRLACFHCWRELPLLYCFNCFFIQTMPDRADNFYIVGFAIFAHDHLKLATPLISCPTSFVRVFGVRCRNWMRRTDARTNSFDGIRTICGITLWNIGMFIKGDELIRGLGYRQRPRVTSNSVRCQNLQP